MLTIVCPLLRSDKWYVRAFDFPRIQIVVLVFIYLVFALFHLESTLHKIVIGLIVLASFVMDFYRIGPYFPIYANESKVVSSEDAPHFKILSANVFINNREYQNIIKLIKEEDPDIVLLLEPDKEWRDGVKELEELYPYHKLVPQENTYGMLLYSKLELRDTEVKFLIDKKVPSIFTDVVVNESNFFEMICVHPRPPRPNEASSLQRDAELITVAKYVEKKKNEPILVIGDLNDVAWSHTTRLFKRISTTLDPRIGRGMFNTFPVSWVPLRVPLDHVFHTPSLGLRHIEVLPDIGSDHFPITVSFDVLPPSEKSGNPEEKDEEDVEESEKITEEAKSYDGPENEVDKEKEKKQ